MTTMIIPYFFQVLHSHMYSFFNQHFYLFYQQTLQHNTMSNTHIQQLHDPHEVSVHEIEQIHQPQYHHSHSQPLQDHFHSSLHSTNSILTTSNHILNNHSSPLYTIFYFYFSLLICFLQYPSITIPSFHILHHPLYTFHSPYTLQDTPSTPYLVNIHSRHHYHEYHHHNSP